jgi:hypothetical protein
VRQIASPMETWLDSDLKFQRSDLRLSSYQYLALRGVIGEFDNAVSKAELRLGEISGRVPNAHMTCPVTGRNEAAIEFSYRAHGVRVFTIYAPERVIIRVQNMDFATIGGSDKKTIRE